MLKYSIKEGKQATNMQMSLWMLFIPEDFQLLARCPNI